MCQEGSRALEARGTRRVPREKKVVLPVGPGGKNELSTETAVGLLIPAEIVPDNAILEGATKVAGDVASQLAGSALANEEVVPSAPAENAKQMAVRARAEQGKREAAERRAALKNAPAQATRAEMAARSAVDTKRQGGSPDHLRAKVRAEIMNLLSRPDNKEIHSSYIRAIVSSKIRFILNEILPKEQKLQVESQQTIRSLNDSNVQTYVLNTGRVLLEQFPDMPLPGWLKNA